MTSEVDESIFDAKNRDVGVRPYFGGLVKGIAFSIAVLSTSAWAAQSKCMEETVVTLSTRTPRLVTEALKKNRRGIAEPNAYLWDTWGVWDAGRKRYVRFALWAPERTGNPSERHALARIKIFESRDGTRWIDRGLVNADQLSWSGQTIVEPNGTYDLFFTLPISAENPVQRLALARAGSDLKFSKPEIILDPTLPEVARRAESLGYHLGSDDGFIMAWRDPHFFEQKLYFAAKARDPQSGVIRPVVGRARWTGGSYGAGHWQVEPPIFLPVLKEATQVEVPNLKRMSDGRLVMSVNLGNRVTDAQTSDQVNTWVQLFVQEKNGSWRPAKGKNIDTNGVLFGPASRVYGFNFVGGTQGNTFLGTGFYRSFTEAPHTLTPLIEVQVQ